MHIFHIHGAKGGVGTTTIAIILAANIARTGKRVALVDDTDTNGVSMATATVLRDGIGMVDGITIIDGDYTDYDLTDIDVMVIDGGTTPRRLDDYPDATTIRVVRNDYPSLARAVRSGVDTDYTVLIEQQGWALSEQDVKRTIGGELITVQHDLAVARAVDAGLILSRVPASVKGLTLEAVTL